MSFVRFATIAAALVAAPLAVPAQAAENQPYSQAAFEAAQAAGRPILIDVHAWWCPVCGSQARTIRDTVTAPQYDKLLVLRINYDKQKADWQKLGVKKQATLIAYHGTRETGRIQYMTDKAKIKDLIASTLR